MIEAKSAAAVEGAPIFNLISPADREDWRACHKRICGGERLSWRFEIVGLRGTCRQMETHAAPLALPDGTVAQLAITRDITQRLRDEEALRELNQTLERRVAERTRALEAETAERRRLQALAQQAQRLEAIGQLTGGVAHDFNNLLTVIIAQAESIIRAAPDNERVLGMAKSVHRVAERGAQLTAQLLAFSRRQLLRPEHVVLQRLMLATGDLVRRVIGEAITVEIDADPTIWPLLVDPAQFESAIVNLAANARDAMPGGGRLKIAMRNAAVTEAEALHLDLPSGDYVIVSVSDTGEGMSPEVQQRCFEPFYTTKDVGKGTGLGLSQVYGFARQSGGTATVESAEGNGTTISLYLPRTNTEPEEAAPTSEAVAVSGRNRMVLIVEDQADVREIIEKWLRELNYRVLVSADGIEARDPRERRARRPVADRRCDAEPRERH